MKRAARPWVDRSWFADLDTCTRGVLVIRSVWYYVAMCGNKQAGRYKRLRPGSPGRRRQVVRIAEKIIIDPQVCFGKPVIEGTRIPVHMVLELLGEGLTPQEIMENCYPHLTEEDILACIRYASSKAKHVSQPGAEGGGRAPASA
jgi:uncharacterized protein (DUF433 family)